MQKVVSTTIKREKGFMYFIKNDPLEIWKAQMGRKKKEEPKSVPEKKTKSEPEVETKDVIIEKQLPATPVEPAVIEPAVMTEGVAQTAEMMAQAKKAKIEQLENQMKEISKTIEELKPRPNNEFKAVDSVKELEESEGKPKRKRFGLFRRK